MNEPRLNHHLLFIDDLKLFANLEPEMVQRLVETIQLCSRNIGIEFCVSKCVVLPFKKGEKQIVGGGIEMSDGE